MKILFVVPDIYLSEPLGAMQLSAVCKKNGHSTKLITLKRHSILRAVSEYNPDIIAYSVMTPDADLFLKANSMLDTQLWNKKKPLIRIMGGPHATYFPEILRQCPLDAICIGEGDNAIANIVERVEQGKNLSGIPNVLCKGDTGIEPLKKELIADLDSLPFVDREILYETVPYYRLTGLRSFLTSRGCPYSCSYCHNHVFNRMFRECGNILRRRSVNNVIEEIKWVVNNYPPVRIIRFGDEVFAHTIDDWLIEFLGRYKKEVGIPFYCLMRSNTLTEDMAKLLSRSGCHSIGMSVETGNEKVRKEILKRDISNETVIRSFEYAKKYELSTYGNTMLGVPGTSLDDDFESFRFTKKLKISSPTFSIFGPYPRTELTKLAIRKGLLDNDFNYKTRYNFKSPLKCYTDREKEIQRRLLFLSPIFCSLPDFFIPILKILLKINLTGLYSKLEAFYEIYTLATRIFPKVYPRNPVLFLRVLIDSMKLKTPKVEGSLPSS